MYLNKDLFGVASLAALTLALTPSLVNPLLNEEQDVLANRCHLVYVEAITDWFKTYNMKPQFDFGEQTIQANTVTSHAVVTVPDTGRMITKDICTYYPEEQKSISIIQVIDDGDIVYEFEVEAINK